MTTSYRRYLLLVLAVGCLLQPILVIEYWKLLEPYVHWAHHRVVDITGFPPLVRWSLVDAYIANTVAKVKKPLILVLGDSEPYGLHVEDDRIFSRLLANDLPNYAVFNISFLDGRFADMEQAIDSLKRHNVHAEFVIFDVDITHFGNAGAQHGGDSSKILTSTHVPLWVAVTAATLPNVRNVWRLKDKQAVIRTESFNYVPLPGNYLPNDGLPLFKAQFGQLLTRLKPISTNIVAYMSPFATESFEHYGFDEMAFRKLTARYTDICRDSGVKYGVKCLNLSAAMTMDDFNDIIHLNRRGHARVARRLRQEIASESGTASSPATGRKRANRREPSPASESATQPIRLRVVSTQASPPEAR